MPISENASDASLTPERADLLDALRTHRDLFLLTVRELSDDQARSRSTVSELTLGGLVKHVTETVQGWLDFVVDGPAPAPDVDWANVDWSDPPAAVVAHQQSFTMTEDETLAGLLRRFDEVAAATDDLVARVDLDADQPLPEAPWFEPGARWTARRVFVHLTAEVGQHAGHADIIREAIDGQKSMG